MNAEEITALNNNQMLKSSLELYAPLDGTSTTPFTNFAQSTNTIDSSAFLLGTLEFNLKSKLLRTTGSTWCFTYAFIVLFLALFSSNPYSG